MSVNFFDIFNLQPKTEIKGTQVSQKKVVEIPKPNHEIKDVPISKKKERSTSTSKVSVAGKDNEKTKVPVPVFEKEKNKEGLNSEKEDKHILDNPKIEEKTEVSEKADNEEAPVKEPSVRSKKPERKVVTISKMGNDHTFANKNNHDFAFNLLNMKIVMDGCGSGNHSEIGPRVFAQLFARKAKELFKNDEAINEENFVEIVDTIFEKMLKVCDDANFIFQNYCFTILVCFETDDEFIVYSCGDGFIIKEDLEGISFEELDDGEYPAYYVYNFMKDKDSLVEYKDGVEFKVSRYSKDEYLNVGVATDGLRFLSNLMDLEKNKMNNFLSKGIKPQIEKLINRNIIKFHDDISICF